MITPYDGLRVLELEGLAGMYCGKILAGFGAEVIKVERPDGDNCRKSGPEKTGADEAEKSLLFAYFNTNKKSITLDIAKIKGQTIFKELVKEADVVIESYMPGQMAKWGLSYDALKEISPTIIMLSITPFGQTGPHSAWKATTDLVLDAMGGPLAEVGIFGKEPLHLGADIMMSMSGMYGLFAIQAAYHNRQFTNTGAHIDLSQQECCLTWRNQAFGLALVDGKNPERKPPQKDHHGLVKCKDGYAMLIMGPKWPDVVKWFDDMGMDVSVFDDPFYQNYAKDALTEWNSVLIEYFNRLGSHYTKKEFILEGQKRKLPAGIVESPNSLLENVHFKARDYFIEIDHPVLGRYLYPGAPAKMTKSRQITDQPAPLLGGNNHEVYLKLGYTEDQISEWHRNGIV